MPVLEHCTHRLFPKCRHVHSDSLSELQSFMPPDLEKHQERLVFFEFPCHSCRRPTVLVAPGLNKAVWTDVTSSARWHPSSSSPKWLQISRSRARKQLVFHCIDSTWLKDQGSLQIIYTRSVLLSETNKTNRKISKLRKTTSCIPVCYC